MRFSTFNSTGCAIHAAARLLFDPQQWRWLHIAAVALMAVCLVACGGGGATVDKDPILGPPLLSVTPPGVPVSTPPVTTSLPDTTSTCVEVRPPYTLTVTFNEPMDANSINTSTFTVTDKSGVARTGTLVYDVATRTASFTPVPRLFVFWEYFLTLKSGDAGIKTSAGVPLLASDYVKAFQTCGGG